MSSPSCTFNLTNPIGIKDCFNGAAIEDSIWREIYIKALFDRMRNFKYLA